MTMRFFIILVLFVSISRAADWSTISISALCPDGCNTNHLKPSLNVEGRALVDAAMTNIAVIRSNRMILSAKFERIQRGFVATNLSPLLKIRIYQEASQIASNLKFLGESTDLFINRLRVLPGEESATLVSFFKDEETTLWQVTLLAARYADDLSSDARRIRIEQIKATSQ